MRWVIANRLYIAWTIALVSALGSLYFGEVLHFEPCRLCWYQRIAMFPLVPFLGIAFYKNEAKVAHYCLPLVFLGASLALYQTASAFFPSIQLTAFCSELSPCTKMGFTPYLSLIAFSSIGMLIFKQGTDH